MKRIEFFGPMGAGKTTLHNKLNQRSLFLNHSLAKNEVYRILIHQIKQLSFLNYFFLKIITYTPIKHRVFSNYDFYHYLKDDKAAAHLIQFILKELEIENSIDKAKTLVRINYFLKDLADVVVLKKFSKINLIIHDESLVQRGLSFTLDKTLNDLERYFENSILPDGVVYVNAPLEILYERLKYRSKTYIGFSGKKMPLIHQIEDSCIISEKILAILERKKIKLLRIDAENDFKSNIIKINEWMKTL